MPLSKREQDEIMINDLMRRHKRQLLEDAALGIDVEDTASDRYKIAHAPKDSHVNPCLVRGAGMVCPPPKTSASRNCWDRGMKGTTRGVAPGSTDPTPSMRVTYADGSSVVVPVTHSRNGAARQKKTATVQRTPETARIHLDHNFND